MYIFLIFFFIFLLDFIIVTINLIQLLAAILIRINYLSIYISLWRFAMFAPWPSHNPVRITKSPIAGKSFIRSTIPGELNEAIYGDTSPRGPTPYPLNIIFDRKGNPFRILTCRKNAAFLLTTCNLKAPSS